MLIEWDMCILRHGRWPVYMASFAACWRDSISWSFIAAIFNTIIFIIYCSVYAFYSAVCLYQKNREYPPCLERFLDNIVRLIGLLDLILCRVLDKLTVPLIEKTALLLFSQSGIAAWKYRNSLTAWYGYTHMHNPLRHHLYCCAICLRNDSETSRNKVRLRSQASDILKHCRRNWQDPRNALVHFAIRRTSVSHPTLLKK